MSVINFYCTKATMLAKQIQYYPQGTYLHQLLNYCRHYSLQDCNIKSVLKFDSFGSLLANMLVKLNRYSDSCCYTPTRWQFLVVCICGCLLLFFLLFRSSFNFLFPPKSQSLPLLPARLVRVNVHVVIPGS